MDTKRINSESYLKQLTSLYRMKYSGKEFDVVLVSDDNAFHFALSHQDELFGGAPIVFCGVNRFNPKIIESHPNVTGVIEKGDFEESLAFAIKARPETGTVYVIVDDTNTGKINLEGLRKTMGERHPHIDVQEVQHFTLQELGVKLEALPQDSIGFFISFWHDREGSLVTPNDLGAVLAKSAVPVFGRSEWMIGRGMVGGKCVSGFDQGVTAGALAARILSGEPASRLPVVMDSPNRFMFDYLELEKHNISIELVPKGSKVINLPFSFYEKYKPLVLTVMLALTMLSGLIFLLLFVLLKRRRAEEAQKANEVQFRTITEKANFEIQRINDRLTLALEATNTAAWEWSPVTDETIASPNWLELFGFDEEDRHKSFKAWVEHMQPDDAKKSTSALEEHLAGKSDLYHAEFRYNHPERGWIWLSGTGKVVERDSAGRPLRMVGINRDITERKKIEQKIEDSLKEKEILLQEIHHRVKNNMQVISGLIGIQARKMEEITESSLRAAFLETESRIKSMALVHEALYRSTDFAHVDFSAYTRQLVVDLFHTYEIDSNKVKLETRIEPIDIDINQAIPCGLIINELLSNTLKHAFRGDGGGRVTVAMDSDDEGMIELSVCDDGVGLPEGTDVVREQSVGLTIVNALVRQLRGEMVVKQNPGCCFQIRFEGN
jgi:PAS domain S-box-containing protein